MSDGMEYGLLIVAALLCWWVFGLTIGIIIGGWWQKRKATDPSGAKG